MKTYMRISEEKETGLLFLMDFHMGTRAGKKPFPLMCIVLVEQ